MPLHSTATFTFLEEIGTDGHSPLKFICEDDHIYYCKYRTGRSLNQHEIDCLFYEAVSNRLLKGLNIPTPELSLIKIAANSFNPKDLKFHKRFCKPGALYLGSKHIEKNDLVQNVSKRSSISFQNDEYSSFALAGPPGYYGIIIYGYPKSVHHRYAGSYRLFSL